MTTKEILIEARQKIAQGWCQCAYQAGGSYCAVGALRSAAFGASNWARDVKPAFDAVAHAAGTNSLPTWNDTQGRTHAEVLAAFDKAIEGVGHVGSLSQ